MKNNQYWEMKEKELQEKVVDKRMVQYLGGYRNIKGPLWGLFFYTRQSIYLQIFPERNIVFSIFWPERKSEQQPIEIDIPWRDVTKIDFPQQKSKLKKFLFSANNPLKIYFTSNGQAICLHLNFSESIDSLKDYVYKNFRQIIS